MRRALHWLDTFEVAPIWRRRFGIVLVPSSLFGWWFTAQTIAREEPPVILGISWLAITLTAIDVAFTADVRVEQEKGGQKDPQNS